MSTTLSPQAPPGPPMGAMTNQPVGAVSASLPLAGRSGLVRVATPGEVSQADQREAAARAAAMKPLTTLQSDGLSAYIRRQYEVMRRHREGTSGWNDRLLRAQRQFNGEYDPDTLRDIRAFGGSEVFARVVSVKCRGATAMLREVYLSGQRSWAVIPSPNPTLPDSITSAIEQLVETEIGNLAMAGEDVPESAAISRKRALLDEADKATRERARMEALNAERRLDDLLVEGGFYRALADVLSDIPLYPFACLKGPVVRVTSEVKWENRRAVIKNVPKMFWNRISPFDLWWTPGAGSVEQADVIERQRLTRADLNALLDLPGYDSKSLREILTEYPGGYVERFMDPTDPERAEAESREDPVFNESGMFDCLEFHGSIQGKMLLEAGMSPKQIKDPVRDYTVQAWMIANRVIKVQLSPSPRKRHPYFITSFEKIPGTIVGNGIPDIISDIQDISNATLRALVNNMAMASGPQVVVNTDMLADEENGDEIYPWKRWRVETGRAGPSAKPIEFFQPDAHIEKLLATYEKMTQIADELSAIPRYLQGSGGGGVGRTASGLAMLMNNASKILQTVAANIDRDMVEPMLQNLYDILMLTDSDPNMPGALRGDENIEVKGVAVAIQRETERQRQIELLQATANPIDMKIMGLRGRARLLRAVSKTTGIDGELIVPPDEQIVAMEKAERDAAMGASGLPPGAAPPAEGGGEVDGAASPPPDQAPQGPPPQRPPQRPPQPGQMPPPSAPGGPTGAVMAQLGRQAQGSQRGGERTGPRSGAPRVNLYEQRAA